MKIRLTGLILIIFGFVAPFVLKEISPTFMYASILSLLFFWAGFLAIFSPYDKRIEFNPYLRWARYAILFNIVWSVLLSGYVHLMYYYESLQVTGYYTLRFFSFLRNPIGITFEQIVPPPMVHQPDGSVHITYSFVRMLLTNFFSLIVYSFVGITVKIIKDKKITSLFTRIRRLAPPHL